MALSVILLSVLSVSCSSSKVKVAVNASPELNPDPNHHSLPVVTRIYQLKDKQQFEAATFNALWKDDTQVLGQDLLSKEEVLVYPGDKIKLSLARQDKAEYIAIVTLFRDYKQGDWKLLQPMKRKTKISLENNTLKQGG